MPLCALGFIGLVLTGELLAARHEVPGLARSTADANKLTNLAVELHRGELAHAETLALAARRCDGVSHTAFIHGKQRLFRVS